MAEAYVQLIRILTKALLDNTITCQLKLHDNTAYKRGERVTRTITSYMESRTSMSAK